MFTPQQIEQISFGRQTFGGYDMQSVDAFLEPLTEDYITLYKENALLKSKMRVLVNKLEEYRKNESSMKDAMVNAQKTCDLMVKEAETKCTQMLNDANSFATENSKNADSLIAQENARVEEARQTASVKIQEIEAQLQACIQALTRIREANRPVAPKAAPKAAPVSGNSAFFDYDSDPDNAETVDATAAVADEISSNLEALVGTTEEPAPKAEPKHPVNDTTTSKFANLQFGRNYDPSHK